MQSGAFLSSFMYPRSGGKFKFFFFFKLGDNSTASDKLVRTVSDIQQPKAHAFIRKNLVHNYLDVAVPGFSGFRQMQLIKNRKIFIFFSHCKKLF